MKEVMDLLEPRSKEVKLDGVVFVAREIDYATDANALMGDSEDGVLRLLIATMRNSKGEALWAQDDLPALKRKSKRKLNLLIAAALEVNGLNGEVEDAKPEAQP